jgi:hypothetical protein
LRKGISAKGLETVGHNPSDRGQAHVDGSRGETHVFQSYAVAGARQHGSELLETRSSTEVMNSWTARP